MIQCYYKRKIYSIIVQTIRFIHLYKVIYKGLNNNKQRPLLLTIPCFQTRPANPTALRSRPLRDRSRRRANSSDDISDALWSRHCTRLDCGFSATTKLLEYSHQHCATLLWTKNKLGDDTVTWAQ